MKDRFRLRFTFWLDMQKSDEAALAETIETLKGERSFVSTIRDGIRLICDLRGGRTETLFELFPWVREATQPASAAPVDQRLQEQIARLEALLIAQGNVPIQPSLHKGADASPTGVMRKKPRSRVEITGGAGKASAETVAKNFLASMKGLATGFFD